jgi:hypothetical protein
VCSPQYGSISLAFRTALQGLSVFWSLAYRAASFQFDVALGENGFILFQLVAGAGNALVLFVDLELELLNLVLKHQRIWPTTSAIKQDNRSVVSIKFARLGWFQM